MKPVDFDLHRPTTVAEATALLAKYGDESKVLAGGQSLIPLLNFRLARPEHLIDLSRIASLTTVHRSVDELSIGAMVTYDSAHRSAAVRESAPLIAEALPHIAHRAIRARGTLGGSVAHADPAAEMPAVIRALDAVVVVAGPQGRREIDAADFFVANLVTALRDDEMLVELKVKPAPARTGAAFDEVARRRGDFALVGAGAQITLAADGTVEQARICLTGVERTPHRAESAESLLLGQRPDVRTIEAAAERAQVGIEPTGDLHATAEYRRDVAGALVERVVTEALDRAAESMSPSLQEKSA
ncbi:xanthine dehydrogenase family protein subunit M [Nocardioidaceae bacterium SCSIO 66511]|nr:xanthine dehydrogenase family protein subunit M [Nocardioidaceae bacterium SCSIO 66511]